MGNLNDAWGNRTVRLGVLAAFVATFVGLPALGQSLGSDAFKKLDAVNWMSSVFLAQDMGGMTPPPSGDMGGMTPPPSGDMGGMMPPPPTGGSYTPPTGDMSGTQYPSGTTGTMYPTSGTQYPSGTTGTMYPTSGTQYPSGTTGTMYPTSGTQYPSGTTGTMYPTSGTQYPSGTTGTMYPTSGTQYPSGTQPTGSMYPQSGPQGYQTGPTSMGDQSGQYGQYSGNVSPEQMKQNCEASGSKWENNACTGPAGAAFGQMGTQYGTQGQQGQMGQYGGQQGQQYNNMGQPSTYQPGSFEMKPFDQFGTSDQFGQQGGQGDCSQDPSKCNGQPDGRGGQYGMPPPMPAGQYGFQFGGQVFSTNYGSDFMSGDQFGEAINEYQDFNMGFGDFQYDFGDDEKFSQTVDSREVERQKRDLNMQIKGQDQMTKEFDRLTKRIDQFVKRLDQRLKQTQKDVERAKKQGGGDKGAGLDASVQTIDQLKGMVQKLVAELEVLKNLQASDYSSIKSSTDTLAEGATMQDIEVVRTNIRKLDTYWTLRDAMDVRVSIIEQLEPAADILSQVAQVRSQYLAEGVSLPGDLDRELSTIEGEANDLFTYREQAIALYEDFKSQAGTIRAMTSSEDINDAMNDLMSSQQDIQSLREDFQWASQSFQQSQPWETMRWAFEGLHGLRFQDEVIGNLEGMKEEIGKAEEVVALLEGLNLQNSGVQRAISELSALVDQGIKMMEKMKAFMDSGGLGKDPSAMDQIFRTMDQLGMSAERSISMIAKYVESNPAALDGLSSEEARMVVEFLNEGPGGPGPRGGEFGEFDNKEDYANDKFKNAYAGLYEEGEEGIDMEALVAQIRADLIEEVTRQVTEQVMAEVAKYAGDEIAGKILTSFMNNTKYLGDKANTLLENTTAVLDRVTAVDFEAAAEEYDFEEEPELEEAFAQLEEIQSEVKETIVADSVEGDLKDYWTEVRSTIESGASAEEVQELVEQGEELLAQNEKALVFEEEVKFNDTGLGENWFDGYVVAARQEGIVSGYKDASGELTGEFKPANAVTYAEALKMALESAGEGQASGEPSNPAVQDHWAAGYYAKAEQLGLDLAGKDPNAQATREDVAVLVSEVFDLGGEGYDYDNAFPDVPASDPNAGHLQAVYEFGIFTGDSGSGTFRPEDPINRAEVSKVMNVAIENAGSVEDMSFDFEVEGGATIDEGENTINFRKVSFLDFLKAMIPLFW